MKRNLYHIVTALPVILALAMLLGCREDKPFEPIVIDTQEELNLIIASNGSSRYEGDLILTGNITSLEVLGDLEKIFGKLAIIDTRVTTLNGLENLLLVTDDITITSTGPNLQNITDFCAIQGLLAAGSFKSISIFNNQFNPSIQDIVEGNCSL